MSPQNSKLERLETARRERTDAARSRRALRFRASLADGVTATFEDPDETAIYAGLVRLAAQASAARSVLDVGCGSAIPTLEAARAGAQKVVGIDCEPSSVELAQHTIQRFGFGARVSARLASWEDVIQGRVPFAPDLIVSNPPYVPCGRGRSVDGGLYGTSMLNAIIDDVPAACGGLALLFGSISDPLSVLQRVVKRGFELTHLTTHSVSFGRYTSMPTTLAHLRRLRAQGRAFFCDVVPRANTAPHAYLTLGLVARRSLGYHSPGNSRRIIDALAALLPEYQAHGASALASSA